MYSENTTEVYACSYLYKETIMILKEKIMVRVSPRDKERLSEQAAEKRLPLSTYVRTKILSDGWKDVPPPIWR